MNAFILLLVVNSFIYRKISLLGYKFSLDRIISCWTMRILLWKYLSCSLLLSSRVARSDLTSPFIPPRWGSIEWRIMNIIFHPDSSLEWLITILLDWGAMECFTQVLLVIATNIEYRREVYILKWIPCRNPNFTQNIHGGIIPMFHRVPRYYQYRVLTMFILIVMRLLLGVCSII